MEQLENLKSVKGIYDGEAPTPVSFHGLANHLIKTNRSEIGMDDLVGLMTKEGLTKPEHAVGDAGKVLGAIKDILEARKLYGLKK